MSFSPDPETLKCLSIVEGEFRKQTRKPCYLSTLYVYLCGTDENPIRTTTVAKCTGMYQQSITRTMEGLEYLGFIKVSRGAHSMKNIEVLDRFMITLALPLPFLLISILLGRTSSREVDTSSSTSRSKKEQRKHETTEGFTLEDIQSDEDWIRVEPILLQYFKPHQISPSLFFTKSAITKHHWRKFNDLLDDPDIDFNEYCKWYRVKKYPRVKFSYGLFVLDTMIAEFKEESEPDAYLDVPGTLRGSDTHKADVKKSKEWLVKFRDYGG